MKNLQRIQIQDFFNDIHDLKGGSLKLLRAVLVNGLKAAVTDGYLIKSPALDIKLPPVQRKNVKPLTREELKHLLVTTKDDLLRGIIYVAAYTGMRSGELIGLRWQDVDLKNGSLHVEQGVKYDREKKQWIVGLLKTPNARRVIPVGKGVQAELKRQKARQKMEQNAYGTAYIETGLVFTPPGGGILPLTTLRSRFSRLIEKSNIERRTFHDLRHTFASIAISQKVNIKALSTVMGHANINITLDTYGHLLNGDAASITRAVADYLDRAE